MGNAYMMGQRGENKAVPVVNTDFAYTGSYSVISDGTQGWRIKFFSSGTFTPKQPMTVDVFLVGGGGAGSYGSSNSSGAVNGGGGGYTKTYKNIVLSANTGYTVMVGAGGLGVRGSYGSDGGASSFGNYAALGGKIGTNRGGAGGSGGGAGGTYDGGNKRYVGGGNGGSNGSNGVTTVSYRDDGVGGLGQGTNTLEFGEAGGELYSGGGGGAGYYYHNDTMSQNVYLKAGNGGAGGSASLTSGGGVGTTGFPTQPTIGGQSPQFALAGGGGGGYGGGGGAGPYKYNVAGGNGCQGIVIIRNAR